jgi:MFS family permease
MYTLVMAAFMLLGAKLGDILGRTCALAIGLAVYGAGSLTTALSPDPSPFFWSAGRGSRGSGVYEVADRFHGVGIPGFAGLVPLAHDRLSAQANAPALLGAEAKVYRGHDGVREMFGAFYEICIR